MTDSNLPPSEPLPDSTPLPPAVDYSTSASANYLGPAPDKDSKQMAMLAHLLTIFTGFVGPLIIWLMKKETSPFVEDQGRESLNFQLTVLIGYVIGGATTFLCIGFIILPAVWVVSLIFAIMGSLKASNGIAYRYPMCIRFIK